MTLQFLCFVASSEAPLARQPQRFDEIDSAVFRNTQPPCRNPGFFTLALRNLSSSLSGLIGPENNDLRAMKAARDDCAKLPK
jgi:hypothetical protein